MEEMERLEDISKDAEYNLKEELQDIVDYRFEFCETAGDFIKAMEDIKGDVLAAIDDYIKRAKALEAPKAASYSEYLGSIKDGDYVLTEAEWEVSK